MSSAVPPVLLNKQSYLSDTVRVCTLCSERNHHVGRYQEKFYFNPGDTGFKVFHTKFASIGVAICWDQWFPEAARAMALQGAEVPTSAMHAAWLAHSSPHVMLWMRNSYMQSERSKRNIICAGICEQSF